MCQIHLHLKFSEFSTSQNKKPSHKAHWASECVYLNGPLRQAIFKNLFFNGTHAFHAFDHGTSIFCLKEC